MKVLPPPPPDTDSPLEPWIFVRGAAAGGCYNFGLFSARQASTYYPGASDGRVDLLALEGPGAARTRFDDEPLDQAHAEYLTSLEPYRNGGAYDFPGEFVIVRGQKP